MCMCCLVQLFGCDFPPTLKTIQHLFSPPLLSIGLFDLSEEGPASPLQVDLLYTSVLVLQSVRFPMS